jgi:hypothetical protein
MCPLVVPKGSQVRGENRLFVVMIALLVAVTMWAAIGAMVGEK